MSEHAVLLTYFCVIVSAFAGAVIFYILSLFQKKKAGNRKGLNYNFIFIMALPVFLLLIIELRRPWLALILALPLVIAMQRITRNRKDSIPLSITVTSTPLFLKPLLALLAVYAGTSLYKLMTLEKAAQNNNSAECFYASGIFFPVLSIVIILLSNWYFILNNPVRNKYLKQ